MSKAAGMFAGEVTPLAPADGAPTDKAKSYCWMEYGSVIIGVCGNANQLDQGELLSVNSLSQMSTTTSILHTTAFEEGVSYVNTKIISFTFAFTRGAAPDPTYFATVFDFHNSSRPAVDVFSINMDSNGYLVIEGANSSGTKILDAQITNNGASFADGELYFCAGVINLSDPTKREFFINNVNIAEDPAYTTWNTYTDDELAIEDTGTGPNKVNYVYGAGFVSGANWADVNVNYNSSYDTDTLGHISFDDGCTLVPGTVWDADGDIRDPQAWEGWYVTQPKVFWGATFERNTGRSEPTSYNANQTELNFSVARSYPVEPTLFPVPKTTINLGIGSKTESV